MGKILKQFSGHSGSNVFLMQEQNKLFVRKINNVQRNYERISSLYEQKFPVPEIYDYDGLRLDMEYVHGLDIKNYLRANGIESLFNFLEDILNKFSTNTKEKDYRKTYEMKLRNFDEKYELPFTVSELIEKLPHNLPQSTYHGDLTLENILKTEDGFYLIDCVKTEYDSFIFDIAKLRQDLRCKWFLRNENIKLDVKLRDLEDKILKSFPIATNNAFVILMLFRVLEHCEKNDSDYIFLMREIRKLWEEMK
jgi:tRNA A-37 threonylcarbamoyl transferase component Bud32